MIMTYVIDDIYGITQPLMEQQYRPDLDRYRSLHIYRGMPNADYSLVISLRRICKHERRKLEPVVLSNFTKYATLEDPSIESSVWRQMVPGRHHGLPTRPAGPAEHQRADRLSGPRRPLRWGGR